MPICKRCGAKYWAMELDENGRCKSCAQKAADQNAQIRRNNYDLCRDGKASSSVQRIYDAFIRKYPNALITDVSIKDDGKKLLMYLDGSPAYYVTFNPLTNDVDLEKYSPNTAPSSQRRTFPGLFMTAIKLSLIYLVALFFFLWLFEAIDDGNISSSSSKPTAVPTATALADDSLAWVSYYAEKGKGDDVSFRSASEEVSAGDRILVIKFFLSPMTEEKDYRIAAAETIINVGSSMRSKGCHKNYDVINFLFYGGFIDKYGNRKESLGIRAWYEDDQFVLLNFSYFENSLYSNPDAIIKAADDYLIHPAYLD